MPGLLTLGATCVRSVVTGVIFAITLCNSECSRVFVTETECGLTAGFGSSGMIGIVVESASIKVGQVCTGWPRGSLIP